MTKLRQACLATLIAVAAALFVLATRNLPAAFTLEHKNLYVEIDGTQFGSFDRIKGLRSGVIRVDDRELQNITLERSFVTDPSLYLWAKEASNQRQELKDIHLIAKDASGREIHRYILKSCQPLSWSIEATDKSMTGYRETVDLAVQKIEIR